MEASPRVSARTILRRAATAAQLGWAASPTSMSATLLLALVDGAVPVAAAWATKVLLDELARGRSASGVTIAWCVAVIAGAAVVLSVGSATATYLQLVMHRTIAVRVQVRLFQRLNAYPGIEAFENPAALDRVRLAEQAGDNAPEEAVGAGIHLVQAAVTATGFVATLCVLWWPMVVLVAAVAMVAARLQLRLGRQRAAVAERISGLQRRQIFFRTLISDVRAAKETRLFGLGNFLSDRVTRDLRAANSAEQVVDRSAARAEAAIGLLGGGLTLCGLAIAAYLAVQGQFSIGDVTVFLAATMGLHATIGGATAAAARAYQALLMFGHYLAIVEELPPVVVGNAAPPLVEGIEFRDVWFRYADHLPWVLSGATFRLPAGKTVGLVGLNGAGKSTIVKLLIGLYQPQRGSIRWDGVDLRDIEPARLRERISAVFQDFMAYDFSAAENIGVGALDAIGDRDQIRRAARDAGADAAISRLPRGYDTFLSRIFSSDEDGDHSASLSGGQWQRIAVARAYLRSQADLLILDEPSSGQDAAAEEAMRHQLAKLRQGRLSVIISHRLNAYRDADLVLVLDGGVVVEQGTHDALITAEGRYSELFRLQSAGYQVPDRAPAAPAIGH